LIDNSPQALKKLSLLDPDVIFLNHGSFGATPRPVFDVYQGWQRRLEHQPVQFIAREVADHFLQARAVLGEYLNAPSDDLVFVDNATTGVNIVLRSLPLHSGDEILTTDHEYGACLNALDFVCRRTGAAVVQQPISLPAISPEDIVEQIWQGVTPRTRLIYLSHITSPTALCLPVEAICQRARQQGILTLVDGAHAPGQVPIDLSRMGVDFYAGNCHKWLSAPKGSAFLYVRPEHQSLIEPLVVSWGWGDEPSFDFGSRFLNNLQWGGTVDVSAYLSVPAAIWFQQEYDWPSVRERCHELARQALHRIGELTGLSPLYPDGGGFYHQMATMSLPAGTDLESLKTRLYDDYRIEIPTIDWQDRPFLRISIQGYNSAEDVDALISALKSLLF
jgi:isopenicillin-N epimerase